MPVLDHYAAQVALNGMRHVHPHDPLEAIDDFMLAVEAAGKHRYSNELDRQLGQLVIATLGRMAIYTGWPIRCKNYMHIAIVLCYAQRYNL